MHFKGNLNNTLFRIAFIFSLNYHFLDEAKFCLKKKLCMLTKFSCKFWILIGVILEKTMAPHSSTLAWKIPWMEEPGGVQPMESLRVRHDSATSLSLSCIGEENGNPLQCSCLENPRDRGPWWAAVYAVAESDTTEAT